METEEVVAKMRRIGTLFKHLSRHLSKGPSKRKGLSADLTLSQARTIWLLDNVGSCTMSELAKSSAVSRPAATSNVDALQKMGLVARSADPGDRRVVRIQLTAKGRKWCQEHRRRHKQNMSRILRQLTGRERAQLADSLEKMYKILSRIEPSGEK